MRDCCHNTWDGPVGQGDGAGTVVVKLKVLKLTSLRWVVHNFADEHIRGLCHSANNKAQKQAPAVLHLLFNYFFRGA